jgi:hypothetical protein
MKKNLLFLAFTFLLLPSCNHEAKCTRWLIPADYLGKIVVYFDKKNGQKEVDKEGCLVYRISEKGEYYSALTMDEGWDIPHKTSRFFEVINKDSIREINEYDEHEYYSDSGNNGDRKYVYYGSSGFTNPTGKDPNITLVYYVDFGKNHKHYGL